MIGGFRSVLCVSLFQGSLLFHDRNDNWWQWKTHFWRQRLNFRVRVFLKYTYIHIPANAQDSLCSIILSCCVWISWWTPRTRSFLTCMVPFLRCLLSINKARAQSEQSPGAAKQTSAISQRATSSCYYKIKSDPPIQFIIWLPFFRPMRRQDNEKFEKYTVMLEEKEGQI